MTSDKKTRFLNAIEIDAAIAEVSELAKRFRVQTALVGGAALQVYGSDRLTVDIDVLANRKLGGLHAKGPLSFGGWQGRTPSGCEVDVIVRNDDYRGLYEDALYDARRVKGVRIPVVLIEYIAAMKLQAGRTKDMADLEFILAYGDLDYPKARAIVKKHLGPYAAEELDNLRDTFAWERSRKP